MHILGVSLAAGLVPLVGRVIIENWFISLVVNGFLYLLIFAGLAAGTKLLSAGEIEQIKKKVRSSLGCVRKPGQK